MTLWIDADACPNDVKEILFRAARRHGQPLILVANSGMRLPEDELFSLVLVPPSADAADKHIAAHCAAGDLVITADIPLAAQVVERGATALNPRGELYTAENVRQALSMRNFMEEMRSGGLASGGPPPLGNTDLQKFANALDRFLVRAARGR